MVDVFLVTADQSACSVDLTRSMKALSTLPLIMRRGRDLQSGCLKESSLGLSVSHD